MKVDEEFEFDATGLKTVTRINTQAPVIFSKMLEVCIDNSADYLTVLLAVLEQMVMLKKTNTNGRIVIHAGSDKGKRTHAVELQVQIKKIVELLDVYQKI